MSRVTEKTHDFTFTLSGVVDFTDAVMDRLYDAGCDDATFGARCGVPYATFHREARSYGDAVESARAAIASAQVGLSVVDVQPE